MLECCLDYNADAFGYDEFDSFKEGFIEKQVDILAEGFMGGAHCMYIAFLELVTAKRRTMYPVCQLMSES